MKDKKDNEISVDLLKHLEDLSNNINQMMARRAKNVFRRYPTTFGLLILIGGITLHEGIKGLMRNWGLLEINPLFLILAGLVIFIITGTLYKKLDK